MAYITRDGTSALVPEDYVREIQKEVSEGGSIALSKMRKLQNMSRNQTRIPVLSALPTAYFVQGSHSAGASDDGSPGLKKTTTMEWANKYIYAEELAVIVPIPQDLLDDSDYDIWGEVKPSVVEAFGVTLDAAIFHGVNAPAAWPRDILSAATAASNTVTLGAGADIYDDILGPGGLYALVEDDGYVVNGAVAVPSMQAELRGLRDTNGQPIFKREGVQGSTVYTIDGTPLDFVRTGALDDTKALMVAGDWSKLVYSMRQDMTYSILTEAIIQDPDDGSILYNLAQQDMVALRCVIRLGWQCPNPVNRMKPVEAHRFPLGVLTPPASSDN
jgi:HK97 family phage major capsid protein